MKRKSKIEKVIKIISNHIIFLFLMSQNNIEAIQGFREGVESHFEIVIVSKIFDNKNKIDRHRMVNKILKDDYSKDLHSVTIKALTLEEFS